jgi:hypothetical protein
MVLASLTLITPSSNGKRSALNQQVQQGRSRESGNGRAKGKRVQPAPPQPGAPAAQLLNVDEVRQRRHGAPRAPLHIESTIRSRRKPFDSRHGRKVGDPLPPKRRASVNQTGEGSERVMIASANAHRRGGVSTARSHHARTTRSLPTGVRGNSSPARLLRLISSGRGLSIHSPFDFLRYPTLQLSSAVTSRDYSSVFRNF